MTKKAREFQIAWWLAQTVLSLALLLSSSQAQADQVAMKNGDRYSGKVVSLNETKLVIESDTLGTLRLSRANVASVTLGSSPVVSTARTSVVAGRLPALPPATTNVAAPNSGISAEFRQLSTNAIQQVTGQMLAGAGPEANNKFNELLGGLQSGRLGVEDIRVQARTAADQIRSLKSDLGNDAGWALDGYLAILEHFLNESSTAGSAAVPAGGAISIHKPEPKPELKPEVKSQPKPEPAPTEK